MSYLSTPDGLKIYYNCINKDKKLPTLVFIHGWLVNWTCFKNEIEYFKSKGYPILYLDLRGHGKSSKPRRPKLYSLKSMRDDLKNILDKEGIKKIIPIGHSMGGMVTLLFNIKYKENVYKSVLIDTSYRNPLFFSKVGYFSTHKKVAKNFCASLVRVTRTFVSKNKIKTELDFSKMKGLSDTRIFLNAMSTVPYNVSFSILSNMFDYNVKDDLETVKNKVLVITSKNDQFFEKRIGKAFAKKLKRSRIISSRGTHSIIIKQPKLISGEIEKFILA